MAQNYIVLPGARIGMENGKLVESLGNSGQGIGSGIGMQAFVGLPPSNYDFQSPTGCSACGSIEEAAQKGIPLIAMFGIIALALWLKK